MLEYSVLVQWTGLRTIDIVGGAVQAAADKQQEHSTTPLAGANNTDQGCLLSWKIHRIMAYLREWSQWQSLKLRPLKYKLPF